MIDINEMPGLINPWRDGEGGECSGRERDMGPISQVKDFTHPIWSSSGLIETINFSRQWANTKEKDLKGEIKEKFFEELYDTVQKTKVPADMIAFCADWDNDLTNGGSAQGVAEKIRTYANSLRSTLNRDPTNAEVFAAYAYQNAGTVKKLIEMAEKKPEEDATPLGSKKDNIINKKLRNGNEVTRKWREVYDFFYKRSHRGRITFTENVGTETI